MIYTDSFLWDWRGKETICGHLFTDGNIEELHEFAQKIGLKREWFQNKKLLKHYDLIGKK